MHLQRDEKVRALQHCNLRFFEGTSIMAGLSSEALTGLTSDGAQPDAGDLEEEWVDCGEEEGDAGKIAASPPQGSPKGRGRGRGVRNKGRKPAKASPAGGAGSEDLAGLLEEHRKCKKCRIR